MSLADQAERAARLAKADLVTGMVGEFPELQGVIGGYLAEAQGEPQAIADAIRDHYGTPCGPVLIAVALADKLDTLAGFFAYELRPTGSKDPFALRRSALAAITMIVANQLRVGLFGLFLRSIAEVILKQEKTLSQRALDIFVKMEPAFGRDASAEAMVTALRKTPITAETEAQDLVERASKTSEELLDFFADRLKVQQRDAGVRHDLIDAVFALGGEDDLVRLLARVNALQQFVETGDGADLLTAYKRAANILKKENWTGAVMSSAAAQGIPQTGEEDPLVLVEEPGLKEAIAEMASGEAGADLPQEQALIAALDAAESKAASAVEAEDFTGAMAALATLRQPIDEFFDHVTVNDPDSAKRERRLNLLMRFRDAVNQVADFSKIEG